MLGGTVLPTGEAGLRCRETVRQRPLERLFSPHVRAFHWSPFPGPWKEPSATASKLASRRAGGRAGGWLVAATAHPATLFSFPMIVSTPLNPLPHHPAPRHPLLTSCYTLVSRLYLGSFLTLVQWPWKESQWRMREDDTLALGARHVSVPSCTSCMRCRRIGSLRRPILISDAVDLTCCWWHSVFHDTVSQWEHATKVAWMPVSGHIR